ncbi:MAG: hypothetical protein M0P66_11635 [Salinivirgaceae bacterium]|nr:hypothetical protein [Salinivirgaceae bacterium]
MKLFLSCIIGLFCFLPFHSQAIHRKKDKVVNDTAFVVVSEVIIIGNVKTKEKVIIREIPFHVGDTIYSELLDQTIQKTKDNLFNTSLFNFIHINTTNDFQKYIKVYIVVEERWYLWPYVIFEQADRNLSSFLNNKDWSRINYGILLVKNNFRGRRETLKLKVRLGYKEQLQLFYQNPLFMGSSNHGITTEINWFRLKEVQYNTISDKPVLYKDYSRYGQSFQNARFTYSYRRSMYLKHHFNIGYTYVAVSDTILHLNLNFLGTSGNYGQQLNLNYTLEIDKRNYKYYPLSGYNLEVTLSQSGFGILKNEMAGVADIEATAYKYIEFEDRWFAGFGGTFKLSTPFKQPYFTERALGYEYTLRADEYYLIDGQHFETARAFLKYAIIPFNVRNIESWGWEKFNKIHYSLFVNAFVEQGYVYDVNPNATNRLPNSQLYSFGVGVDLVAYYDLILRFEYSMNQLKQHGFFLNVGKAF